MKLFPRRWTALTRAMARLCLLSAAALTLHAAGMTVDLTPTSTPGYFHSWYHHNGSFVTDPVVAFTIPPDPPPLFGYMFDVNSAQTIDRGFATDPSQVWDTALLREVAAIHVSWSDMIFRTNGATFRSGSVVWNTTTDEFFFSIRNNLTTNPEAVIATLTPAADYCRLENDGSCSAITTFGHGLLQFGFVIEADLTNEVTPAGEPQAVYPAAGFSEFTATVHGVPEPSTLFTAFAGAACFFLLSRHRRRISQCRK